MDPNDQNQGGGQGDQPVSQPTDQPVDQPTQPATQNCATCGGGAAGFKCALCGEESDIHDENHRCGGLNCQPKCVGCYQAESKCTCTPAGSGIGGPSEPVT